MDIASILQNNFPGKIWTLDGEDYEGLTWLDDSPKPTKEELEAINTESSLAQKTVRESALAKLVALGLTEEEIATLSV
jgi:hypothetical protein